MAPKKQPPSSPEQPARSRRREQLAELADIAADAVALQPDANSAVSQCGVPGAVSDAVGLELGKISHAYSLVFERARHLPVDSDLVYARSELCRLISYHQHMLRDAGDLAFSGRADARTEPFRRELARGLGPFATELVELADEFRRVSAAPAERPVDRWDASADLLLDDVDLSADEP